jgi:hypothetical protein
MREITLDNVGDVSDDKYYGINELGTAFGVVSRDDFQSGPWTARCGSSFTKGNSWDRNVPFETLYDCIHWLIGGTVTFQVFEFDSFKELCAWIANDGTPVSNRHGEELEVL